MKFNSAYVTALLVALFMWLPCPSALGEQLVVPGSGANEVILQQLAAAFNAARPEHEIIIPPSIGSAGGIRVVGDGENILGRVSRQIRDNEIHYGLEYLPFAKDMVVFVVGPGVGIDNLSTQQLADVFFGKVRNWKLVGGNDEQIRLLVRDQQDDSLQIIREKIQSFRNEAYPQKAKVLFHDNEMVSALNKYSTVIGWLTFSSMNGVRPSARAISIDSIAPTQENLYDGKYALGVYHALVYKQGNLDGLARKFVDFIFSKKGNRILVDNGLIPVNHQQK